MNAVQTPSVDELRRRAYANWESVAPAWGRHADFLEARATPVTTRMLELADLQPDDRVLDLAGGPGGLGLLAAEQAGSVVISDIAPGMIAIGSARAEDAGLANVATRVLDLEAIDEPGESYDAVLCRDGIMLVPEPDRAAAEVRRVLRDGGRFVLAVWGPPARNPWLSLIFRTVGEQTGMPVPPAGTPGPFSLGDAGRLAGLLTDAGLREVIVEELDVPYRTGSFDEWIGRSSELAGPVAQTLAAMLEPERAELRERLREVAQPFTTAEGIEFPGLALVASGRR
jgi:ubiquinone/menaquinone biosynthesis C-methylase UbiE